MSAMAVIHSEPPSPAKDTPACIRCHSEMGSPVLAFAFVLRTNFSHVLKHTNYYSHSCGKDNGQRTAERTDTHSGKPMNRENVIIRREASGGTWGWSPDCMHIISRNYVVGKWPKNVLVLTNSLLSSAASESVCAPLAGDHWMVIKWPRLAWERENCSPRKLVGRFGGGGGSVAERRVHEIHSEPLENWVGHGKWNHWRRPPLQDDCHTNFILCEILN